MRSGGGDSKGLGGLHRLLSALKVYLTWDSLHGMEECRQVCGGHGFLAYSGISSEELFYSAAVTFEGENAMMSQQVGRGLLQQL